MTFETVNTSVGASISLENEDSKVLLDEVIKIVKKSLEQSIENCVPLYFDDPSAPTIDLTSILEKCSAAINENKKCEAIRPAINSKEYRRATIGGVVEIGSSLSKFQDVKKLFDDFLKRQSGLFGQVGAIDCYLSNHGEQDGMNPPIIIKPDDVNSILKNIDMGVYKENSIKHAVTINKKEFSIDKEEKDGCFAGVISVLHEHALAKNESEFNDIVGEFVGIAAKKYLPKEFIESDADSHDLVGEIEDELYSQAWKNGSDMQMFLGFLFEHSFSYGRRYIESFMMNKLVSSNDKQCNQQTIQYFDYVYNLIKNINDLEEVSFDVSRRIGGGSDYPEKISFNPMNNMGVNGLFKYLPVCLHQPNILSEESKKLEWQTVADRTSTLKTKVSGRMTHDFNDGIMFVRNERVYKIKPTGAEETPYAIKILNTLNDIGYLYDCLQKKGAGFDISDIELGLLRKYTKEVLCLCLANPFLWDGYTVDKGYQYYRYLKHGLPSDNPLLLLERLSYACLEMYCRHTKACIMGEGIRFEFQNQAFCIENIFTNVIVGDVLKVLKSVGNHPIRVGLTVKVREGILDTDAIKKWNNTILGVKIKNLPGLIKNVAGDVYANNIEWSNYLSFECNELSQGDDVVLEPITEDRGDCWLRLRREYELSTLTMNFSENKSLVKTIKTKTSSKCKMLPVFIINQNNLGSPPGFLTIKVNEEYFDDSRYKINNKSCAQNLIMRDMCFIVILQTVFQHIKDKFYSKTSRKVSVLRAHCNNNINASAFHSCISAVSVNSQEMMISTQGVDFTRPTNGGSDMRALNLAPSMLKKSIEEHGSAAISEYCQDKVTVVVYITVRASYQKGVAKKHTLTCQGYFVDKSYFVPKFTASFNESDGEGSWWLLMDELMSLVNKHTRCVDGRVKDVILVHRLKNAKRRGYTSFDNRVLFDDATLKNINDKYQEFSIIPLHMDEMFFISDPKVKNENKNKVLVYKDLDQLRLIQKEADRVFVPILGYATLKTVGNGHGRFYNSMNLLYVDKKQMSERNLKNVDAVFMEAMSDIFLLSSVNESENRSVVMNPYAWIRPKDIKYAGEVSYIDDGLSLVVSHTGICAALNTVSLDESDNITKQNK